MLVLLHKDNLPPMSYRLAVIVEIFPGPDGQWKPKPVLDNSSE
jgi:hypothetical protein